MNPIAVPNRSITMNLMHEDLARAQIRTRLEGARRSRRGAQLARARRHSRRTERTALRARLARGRTRH